MNVFLMRGVSGSGKSTCAKTMAGKTAIVSADSYFMVGEEYKFDPRKLGQAHAWCYNKFLEFCCGDYDSVIVDNTNLKLQDLRRYVLDGHKTVVVNVRCPVEKLMGRNVHGVPDRKITQMLEVMASEDQKVVDFCASNGVEIREYVNG